MKIYFTTLILFVAILVACVQAKPRKGRAKKLCNSNVDIIAAEAQMKPLDFLNMVPAMECLASNGYDPCDLSTKEAHEIMESCGSEIMSSVEKLPDILRSQQDTTELNSLLDAIHDEDSREKRQTGTGTGTGTRTRTGTRRLSFLRDIVRIFVQLSSDVLTCVVGCLGSSDNLLCVLGCLGGGLSGILPLLA